MLNTHPLYSDKAKEIVIAISDKSVHEFVQLLLDCSVIPQVIAASQSGNSKVLCEIFKFTRTWCFQHPYEENEDGRTLDENLIYLFFLFINLLSTVELLSLIHI